MPAKRKAQPALQPYYVRSRWDSIRVYATGPTEAKRTAIREHGLRMAVTRMNRLKAELAM